MLRGKQWLIVGDGKQVSPTESFISEESIDSLRAALPKCPLEDSLLPGQSFFDLCAQAYPKGRVVLSEHFRCAPEIINFSNHQFYDGRLVPLRLPTSNERLSPSLIDVRVPGGIKVGKVNVAECDEIVRMVHSFITDSASQYSIEPRSIGIISLVGNEQASLIRGRLLDRIGPQKFKEHNILIGDPPTFQGAERDLVFLSMVCSNGTNVSQTRLMHAQRTNVALSRARDRMVLVRSIDAGHIANGEDMKLPVIEFFEAASRQNLSNGSEDDRVKRVDDNSFCFRARAIELLQTLLERRGFSVRTMGVVWKDGLCVEHPGSTSRAAISVENCGETKQEWLHTISQQKSIERVGWKCLRVDGLSLLIDYHKAFMKVIDFLASAGVEEPPLLYDSLEEETENGVGAGAQADVDEGGAAPDNVQPVPADDDVVIISSDDENERRCRSNESFGGSDESDEFDPSQYGEVVQMSDFLGNRGNAKKDDNDDDGEEEEEDEDEGSGRFLPDRNESQSFNSSVSASGRGRSHSRERTSKRSRSGTSRVAQKDRSTSRGRQSDDSEGESFARARKRDRSASSSSRKRRSLSEDSRKMDATSRAQRKDSGPSFPTRSHSYDADAGESGCFEYSSDSDEAGSGSENGRKRRRKSYRRLDKHSRDPRYYDRKESLEPDDLHYDTDSDLHSDDQAKSKQSDDDDEEEFKPFFED